MLRGAAAATYEGPFGQAHELREDGVDGPPFKSFRGYTRYVADNGAAFLDATLRGLGALSPQWAVREPADLLDAVGASSPRGVNAQLVHVRTPFGSANVSMGMGGVKIQVDGSSVVDRLGMVGAVKACGHARVECVGLSSAARVTMSAMGALS